jgi:hypothetical protein
MANEIVSVPFHGDTIHALRNDQGEIFVVCVRVCEALGIDWASQYVKLKKASWSRVVMITTLDGKNANQGTYVMPLDSLPMWMSHINPAKVATHLKEKLELFQLEARDVLARHFLGIPSPPEPRPWAIRFRETFRAHVCELNVRFPGCFTVISGLTHFYLDLEDQLMRHFLKPRPTDLPDGSIGGCWGHERRRRGYPAVDEMRRCRLHLPKLGIDVSPIVYPNAERGDFEAWFYNTYLPEKLPNYLINKEEFSQHGELTPASVADITCRGWSGQPAQLKPKVRKDLDRAGGFFPVGAALPAPEYQQTLLALTD